MKLMRLLPGGGTDQILQALLERGRMTSYEVAELLGKPPRHARAYVSPAVKAGAVVVIPIDDDERCKTAYVLTPQYKALMKSPELARAASATRNAQRKRAAKERAAEERRAAAWRPVVRGPNSIWQAAAWQWQMEVSQ